MDEAEVLQEGPKYTDKSIVCVDCPDRKEFIWEAGEQEFFARNELHPPIRCPYHRKLKAQKRREAAQKGIYDRPGKTETGNQTK